MEIHPAIAPGDRVAIALFQFKNTGSTPVTITNVQPACGCTTTELAKHTYAPGEIGTIKAVLTFGDMQGKQRKSILVTTDDVPFKPTELILQVVVPELLNCTPTMLLWRTKDELAEKSSVISAASSVRITSLEIIKVTSKDVNARIELIEAGKEYRVIARPGSLAKEVTTSISCVAKFENNLTRYVAVNVLVR